MAVWADGAESPAPHAIAALPARVGRTLGALPPGPLWRWDRAAALEVEMATGSLVAPGEAGALAGAGLLAL